MRTPSIRGAGGALLALALVTTSFTPAQATPVPASATSARLTAASPGITGLESRCPAGQVPSTIHSYQGFEAGLPFPDPLQTDGFTIKAGTGALEGSHWLNSSFQASDPATEHFVTTNHDAVPQTGNIYLAIGYRAAVVGPFVEMHINRAVESFGSNPNWSSVFLDITSEATTAGGTVDVSFRHRPNTTTPAGSFEVDAVMIYSCKVFVTPTPVPPAPAARVDFTGDGKADVLAVRGDGTLYLYRGNGLGGFAGQGTRIGTGWGAFTKVFSAGDFTGGGKADVLAVRGDGTLYLYRGNGLGGFAGQGTRIGTGWGAFVQLF